MNTTLSDEDLNAWDADSDEIKIANDNNINEDKKIDFNQPSKIDNSTDIDKPHESLIDTTAVKNHKHNKYIKKLEKKRDKKSKTNVQTIVDNQVNTSLRSPICCVLGHVDTGKTLLLDKIRCTNVQKGEAGGITQQIGATFFPSNNLLSQCLKVDPKLKCEVPGLLIIDTPGHTAFSNLRQRGSALCDIAILVVDIMHGIEQQTIESIQILKAHKCPFVVALNKIDRIYKWNSAEWAPLKEASKNQSKDTIERFKSYAKSCINDLIKHAKMNFALVRDNKDPRSTISVIPTSAKTGEGIPDLLATIINLTQKLMHKRIKIDNNVINASVLDVKSHEGLGPCIDVLLVSGVLRVGDRIAVCGMNEAVVTTIRALVTPQPMKELRVKSDYIHHQEVYAAIGVKIVAPNLENAIAGANLYLLNKDDNIEEVMEKCQSEVTNIIKTINKASDGVYVVASTLGSLEALLEFLKESNIPVNNVSIGTVHKLDVVKCSTMREREKEEYAVILAFDVKITPEAKKEAANLGVTIFEADIIYHLFDKFVNHMNEFNRRKKEENAEFVIYPCIMKLHEKSIFNNKDPIIIGVEILEGELHPNSPIYCPDKDLDLGTLVSIENDRKPVDVATKGMQVAIKIIDSNIEINKYIKAGEIFVTKITRKSIDIMKEFYVDDLRLHASVVVKLKKILNIT